MVNEQVVSKLKNEYLDLQDSLSRLRLALVDRSTNFSASQLVLLEKQKMAMIEYAMVLEARILDLTTESADA